MLIIGELLAQGEVFSDQCSLHAEDATDCVAEKAENAAHGGRLPVCFFINNFTTIEFSRRTVGLVQCEHPGQQDRGLKLAAHVGNG